MFRVKGTGVGAPFKIYAKFLVGQYEARQRRVPAALRPT